MVTKNIWLIVHSSCILQKYLAAYMLIAVLLFVSVPHRENRAAMDSEFGKKQSICSITVLLCIDKVLANQTTFPALSMLFTEEALVSTHSI